MSADVSAEHQVLKAVPDVLADDDVEDGVDEAVEVGQHHHVPKELVVVLLEDQPPEHEDDGVRPPTDEKCWDTSTSHLFVQMPGEIFFSVFFLFLLLVDIG